MKSMNAFLDWTQLCSRVTASRTPKGANFAGGCQRSSPTGGAAMGTPKELLTGFELFLTGCPAKQGGPAAAV